MRSVLALALFALACSSESSMVSGSAGSAGYSGASEVSEAGSGQGEPGGASSGEAGASVGGVQSGFGGASRDGAPGVGGDQGEVGAAGAETVDPYDKGNGKRCPWLIEGAPIRYGLLEGELKYYSVDDSYGRRGMCYAKYEPIDDPQYVIDPDTFEVVADARMAIVDAIPDSCAEVVLIPSDGSDPRCVTIGWYAGSVDDGSLLTELFDEIPDSYWTLVARSKRVVADRNSTCPDWCAQTLGGA